MFETGDWVTDIMGQLGFIEEVKVVGKKFVVLFPENEKIATRYLGEISHAPIETLYNDYNIHFLQTLAVNTGDKDWFNNLSKKLGVEK